MNCTDSHLQCLIAALHSVLLQVGSAGAHETIFTLVRAAIEEMKPCKYLVFN